MNISDAVAERILELCDGLDMTITEFLDTEQFRSLGQELYWWENPPLNVMHIFPSFANNTGELSKNSETKKTLCVHRAGGQYESNWYCEKDWRPRQSRHTEGNQTDHADPGTLKVVFLVAVIYLMITAVGTLGKTYIVKSTDRFYYKDASVICLENYRKVSSEYLKYLIMSPYMETSIKDNSSGTTVGTITLVRANEYLLPIPPLAEQNRIVSKMEELLPYIDKYGTAETKLTALNTTFPEALKKSIL